MRKITLLIISFLVANAYAQTPINIVPEPVSIKTEKGIFVINNKTEIIYKDASLQKTADLLQSYFKEALGLKLNTKPKTNRRTNRIELSLVSLPEKDAYSLKTNKDLISISAKEAIGVFYGTQTLKQLIPAQTTQEKAKSFQIAAVSIYDYPRFGYRGMHLDICRHFEPISYIKKYIDYLAFHKFNTFHWHLTDDQGWRLQIKKYPLLTEVGGYRNGTIIGRYPGTGNDGIRHGGFYTQDEARDIVKYAAERFINVIPEIEMPGHASAAIAAYPQLSCFPDEDTKIPVGTAFHGSTKGKNVQQTWGVFPDIFAPTEYTFNFLENVLDEVIEIFPSKMIHIGGDEAPKDNWKRSEFCQQLIKEKNLKDEHELQSYFIQRIEKYLNQKGRKIIGWDEILEGGLAPNAAVMSWRGEKGGIEAAKQKHEVVMTPSGWAYFDHTQSLNEDSVVIGGYTPLEKVYGYEPIPAELNPDEHQYVLGAQANLWAEYIKNPSKIEYMIFPRMSALSEVLWSPKEIRNWDRFQQKIPGLFKRYESWGTNYSKAYYNITNKIIPSKNNTLSWQLSTTDKNGKIIYKYNNEVINNYSNPIVLNTSGKISAVLADENNQPIGDWLSQDVYINKASGKPVTLSTEPAKNYPGQGSFTLTDGVQNSKGMSRTGEFLGFLDRDVDVVIDLETTQNINTIKAHVLEHKGSWIFAPRMVSYFKSMDGVTYEKIGDVFSFSGKSNLVFTIEENTSARYIKVRFTNPGTIPDGNAGAGRKAWLFIDEIEIL